MSSHILDHQFGITGRGDALHQAFQENQHRTLKKHTEALPDGVLMANPDARLLLWEPPGSEIEFFAYASEWFFTAPHLLADTYPPLYRHLVGQRVQ